MNRQSSARDDLAPDERLRITEIFHSIQGESRPSGFPTVFIRLTGCNLRCAWCDTSRAWENGRAVERERVLELVLAQGPRLVVLTGGEPLLQANSAWLAQELLRAGWKVSVETNGSMDIEMLPPGAHVVLDMKVPSSGETDKMDFDNLSSLRPGDDLKIVVAGRADFDWTCQLLKLRSPGPTVNIFLSPAFQRLRPTDLANWIIEQGLEARLQFQMHRLLWPDGEEAMPLPMPD